MINDWKEITKQSYNTYAKNYATFAQTWHGKGKNWIEEFASRLTKGNLVLDVGCGVGRDALFLTNKGLRVIGIDLSQELVKLAKKKVNKATFLIMDFEELHFPNKHFDGAWAMASLLHLPKARLLPVLKKIHAVLKKEGLFFGAFRLGEGEKFTEENRGDAILRRFYAYYTQEELENFLKSAGFRHIEKETDVVQTGKWVGIFARK